MSAEKKKVVETSAKDDERKPQREAPRSAANATPSAAVQRPRRQQQPRKVRNPAKVGKANLKRDIPLFLGLVGFLFFVAWLSSGIGGTNEKKKSIKELQDDLRKQFEVQQAREQARKRTTECDLFLASSSIPGAGVGVFAGKQFQVGEEVIHPGVFYPVESQQDSGNNILVSQYGFLLKHHPHLANLQGGPTWSDGAELNSSGVTGLKAARVIEPGEELFLSLDEHPQFRSDFFSLPTLEDYEVADEIVRDEIKSQRRAAGRSVVGAKSLGATSQVLMLVKKSVEKVNKRVAALLPGSAKSLETRDLLPYHSVLSALQNRTVSYLESNGQCLDDVLVKSRITSGSEMGIFARRPIKKGNVVVPVPLYVTRRRDGSCVADGESCTGSNVEEDYTKQCFGDKDSSLLLCPLSPVVFPSGENDSPETPNAALKWSSRINVKSIHKVRGDEILKNYATSLSLDVVALRAIEPGEEILIERVKDSSASGGFVQVDDSIYSKLWKDYKVAE